VLPVDRGAVADGDVDVVGGGAGELEGRLVVGREGCPRSRPTFMPSPEREK
jgi:hypothetical protein